MLALLVRGLFHWGFSARIITESAGAQYYPYPPPSTLIGALAYGVNVVKGLPECNLLASGKGVTLVSSSALVYDAVPWATFAFSDELSAVRRSAALGYSDFIRAFRLLYQRVDRHKWEQSDMWYGVNAHGKVYACGAGFKAFYLVDEKRSKDLGLSYRDLLTAACSIVRIGAREGLVSVISVEASRDVKVFSAEEAKVPFETEYYFPARLAEDTVEEAEVVHLPRLDKKLWEFRPEDPLGLHEHEEYYAPSSLGLIIRPGKMRVNRLTGEGALVVANFSNNVVEKVVVPLEVVKR